MFWIIFYWKAKVLLPFYRLALIGKTLLFQFLPGFLPVKEDNDIMSNGLTSLHDSATVRNIYTFFVFCSVNDLFFRFTRVYEGHFMLCFKEEPSWVKDHDN